MTACTFDAETHEYRIGGRKVVGVTTVLNDLIPGYRASDWYLQRGRAVHAAAAMILALRGKWRPPGNSFGRFSQR